MRTARLYITVFALFVLAAGAACAYHCLFSGSPNYPAENKEYCSKQDSSGRGLATIGCDTYSYFYHPCMIGCCGSFGGEAVTFSGEDYSDNSLDTSSVYYEMHHNCEAEGKCVYTGFNAVCLYPITYEDHGTKTVYHPIDQQKLDACVVECATGDLPGDTGMKRFDANRWEYILDKVPPTLRSCVCDFVNDYYSDEYVCTLHGEVYVGGGVTSETPQGHGTEEEAPPEKSACSGVECENECRVQGGVGVLYHGGKCYEDKYSEKGYECKYATSECEWGCASQSACAGSPEVQVEIREPVDGSRIDTGKSDSARVRISGSTIKSGIYGMPKVYITVGFVDRREANYDYSTGQFYLDNVEIQKGRPVEISAVVYSQDGNRLGSDSVVVYTTPEVIQVRYSTGSGVTAFHNNQQLTEEEERSATGQRMTEGDEFLVTGSGVFKITYSDGTEVFLMAPAKVSVYKGGLHVLYGGVEVDVEHDYEVLTRQGHYINKGTRFTVLVPQEGDASSPETLIVSSGTVYAMQRGSDSGVEVDAGEKLELYPDTVPTEESVQEAAGSDYALTPSGEGASGSCLGLVLLGTLLLAVFAVRARG